MTFFLLPTYGEGLKVVWRCATRMEKGKEVCDGSPTINEEWLKEQLAKILPMSTYDENVVRNGIDKIQVFDKCLIVCGRAGEKIN